MNTTGYFLTIRSAEYIFTLFSILFPWSVVIRLYILSRLEEKYLLNEIFL